MIYKTQVEDSSKYKSSNYLSPRRWSSYTLQVREVMLMKPKKVLEIGPGNGVVTRILKDLNYTVETLDIDERISPDYIGSITDESVTKQLSHQFDLVLACEIFEHIRYEDFLKALGNLRHIAPNLIISIPSTELNTKFFHLSFKAPGLSWFTFTKKLYYKIFEYKFNGEHYWEIGTRGYSLKKVLSDMTQSGWAVKKEFLNPENPYHHFFILTRNES